MSKIFTLNTNPSAPFVEVPIERDDLFDPSYSAERKHCDRMIEFYADEVATNGINTKNWQNFDYPGYKDLKDAFGRQFVDKLKGRDILYIATCIRFIAYSDLSNVPKWDLKFVQSAEYKARNGDYDRKNTRATHNEKWRMALILMENL